LVQEYTHSLWAIALRALTARRSGGRTRGPTRCPLTTTALRPGRPQSHGSASAGVRARWHCRGACRERGMGWETAITRSAARTLRELPCTFRRRAILSQRPTWTTKRTSSATPRSAGERRCFAERASSCALSLQTSPRATALPRSSRTSQPFRRSTSARASHAIADREDGVEVVVLQGPTDIAGALSANL
jgi:hypothetical protein